MTPETNLKVKVSKYLNSLKPSLWWFKVLGGDGQKVGVPDTVGCYCGKFFAIELKREDGKGSVDPKQEYEIKKIRKAGGQAIVAESLDEVKEFIECL